MVLPLLLAPTLLGRDPCEIVCSLRTCVCQGEVTAFVCRLWAWRFTGGYQCEGGIRISCLEPNLVALGRIRSPSKSCRYVSGINARGSRSSLQPLLRLQQASPGLGPVSASDVLVVTG